MTSVSLPCSRVPQPLRGYPLPCQHPLGTRAPLFILGLEQLSGDPCHKLPMLPNLPPNVPWPKHWWTGQNVNFYLLSWGWLFHPCKVWCGSSQRTPASPAAGTETGMEKRSASWHQEGCRTPRLTLSPWERTKTTMGSVSTPFYALRVSLRKKNPELKILVVTVVGTKNNCQVASYPRWASYCTAGALGPHWLLWATMLPISSMTFIYLLCAQLLWLEKAGNRPLVSEAYFK